MKKGMILLLLALLFMINSSQAQAAFWDKKPKGGLVTAASDQPSKTAVSTAQGVEPIDLQKAEALETRLLEEKRKADEERSQMNRRKQEGANSFTVAMQEGKSLGFVDRKPTGEYVTAEDRRKSEAESAKGDTQALFSDEKIELTPEEEEELKKKAEEIQAQVRAVKNVKVAAGAKTVRPPVVGAAAAQQARVASTSTANSRGSNLGASVSAAQAASTGGGYRR